MRLVVDTNILFSFFNKNSFTRRLLENPNFNLISPEYSLEEIKKYSNLITSKTKISEKRFKESLRELKKIVKFIPQKRYLKFLRIAGEISPDFYDKDFLALCLKENSVLWSNDKILKNQNKVKVLSTEEILKYF